MYKRIIGIVLGVIVGGAFVLFGETTGHYLFPANSPMPLQPDQWSSYFENEVPFMAKLMVLVSYALSAFAASIISTFITGRNSAKPMLAAVGILNAFAIMNFLYFSHPTWMWVGMLIAFIPVGFIAYFLIRKKETNA